MSCGRCTSWHPPARGGIQIPGTVDEGGYHESILQNDCESILTKGYESILWMVMRPALQAAEYEDLLCRQPDTHGSPWRTQVRDHGFDRVLFLCRRRKGDIITVCATTNVEINKVKTYVPVTKTSSLSPRAFPFRGSIVRRAQFPLAKVTPYISPSSVGLVVILQSTLEILTDRMYSFSHR